MVALSAWPLLLGVFLVLPIGGADMPVVISLLNAYAGSRRAAAGSRCDNTALIIAGHAGRSVRHPPDQPHGQGDEPLDLGNVRLGRLRRRRRRRRRPDDGGGLTVNRDHRRRRRVRMAYASQVIVVPGYGMAVAQAQHAVRELADLLEKRGVEVKYAIHPVAGRMPGHMNVLLAEANVPYDQLHEMEEINDEFPRADVALVIGANDVVNPAARERPRLARSTACRFSTSTGPER